MSKQLKTLAKEYEFKTPHEYLNYIVESKINGNVQQVKDLFNQMKKDDKEYFINEYLTSSCVEREVKKICIKELLK